MSVMPQLGPLDVIQVAKSHHPISVATVTIDSGDTGSSRWRMLALLATAELLGMSLWFAASAVSTSLASRWEMSTSVGAAWLTTTVQLGFVAGTAVAAVLNLADI